MQETSEELLNLPKRLREMGIKVRMGFYLWWEYSRSYQANFSWRCISYSVKGCKGVGGFLKYVEELKDDILFIRLGSEGHYSICNHWAFVYFKSGDVHAIKLMS